MERDKTLNSDFGLFKQCLVFDTPKTRMSY